MKCCLHKGYTLLREGRYADLPDGPVIYTSTLRVQTGRSNRIKCGEDIHLSHQEVYRVVQEERLSPGRYATTAVYERPLTEADLPNMKCRCKKWCQGYFDYLKEQTP